MPFSSARFLSAKGSSSPYPNLSFSFTLFAEGFRMRVSPVNESSAFPGLTPALLAKYTNVIRLQFLLESSADRAQLEEYISTTNPAPNGSKDLSEVRTGDIICLEGSPCKISSINSTGRLTFVQGNSLIDDILYAARFNHCYGVTVGTFSGRPELLQCLVVSLHPPATIHRPELKKATPSTG